MTSSEQTTVQAADLAEWIVDEISEADQDWHAIERRARELLELVAGRARVPPRSRGVYPDRTLPDRSCAYSSPSAEVGVGGGEIG